ncbi:MAG: valine--tRNA ligase [Elusimicrobia bacterium]|nr:valine--tRNA ligase [Elusimicrobiota bacterium]
MEMDKIYDAKKVEEKWVNYWINNKTFSSKIDKTKKSFTIVIPPPNVTGSLHMGHALNDSLQDAIIRFKKMQGYNTLWVPGTDHGGIATQNVVEKLLKKEGKTKYDLGREKFIEKMWQWRQETGDTILDQLKKLGCGLDWDRTRFTMDEACSKAVKRAFKQFYDKGLIYRGKRLVNWCPRCNTALSDIEVEYHPEKGNLWYIKYPIKDSNEFLTVATTRPETMIGDTAVAVNPNDERYKNIVGKTIILPLVGREIKVVADYIVDMQFGTGAVKVTPAHDAVDYEIARRHNLEILEVIDANGNMTGLMEKYKGMSAKDAREQIVADLQEQGYLIKTEDYSHSVGKCYRCGTTIEPIMSEQWFLKVEEMSKRASQAAKDEKVKFYPASWKKPYTLWLDNLRDWCISRQIWWGHRIPVYYCVDEQGKQTSCPPIVEQETPKKCPHCGNTHLVQDNDVLDTWFSSAMWPFSVFNWGENPDNNEELKYYYPTGVLVTGHEILYLWVARMVQMGLEFLNDIPFSDVFIHGIVRDKHGLKMSKSKGNVINPLEIMDQFGTDALRFALAQSAAPGRDMQISNDSFLAARNFANKIWNASRFILMNKGELEISEEPIVKELSDKWILNEYNQTIKAVTRAFEVYDIDVASRTLYDFIWTKFCDWYIELSKIRMNSENIEEKKQVLSVLIYVLKGTIKMLAPIMPFICDELWGIFNNTTDSIVNSDFPVYDEKFVFADEASQMAVVQEIVSKIRNVRSEMNISPAAFITAKINVLDDKKISVLENDSEYIKSLAKIKDLSFGKDIKREKNSALAVATGFEIFIPLEGLIDLEKEKARINKEIGNVLAEQEKYNKKLSNPNFVAKAPEAEVARIRQKLADTESKLKALKDTLSNL